MNLFAKIFGTKRARDVKKLRPYVEAINRFDEQYKSLSDDELRAKTPEFKERLKNGETLDDIMCEAFAVVKNACRRMCGNEYEVCGHTLRWEMVPFDVQLMGGIVLHQGKIAEMQTGEGKTLVATLPLYLNALTGNNVHLVTVNDYLALRDSQWVGQVFKWLGLTVGCIQNTMNPMQRREQYACDVTYGTNYSSLIGFDSNSEGALLVFNDNVYNTDNIRVRQNTTNYHISSGSEINAHVNGNYLYDFPNIATAKVTLKSCFNNILNNSLYVPATE
jgi:preprotein translocase subunit SecA